MKRLFDGCGRLLFAESLCENQEELSRCSFQSQKFEAKKYRALFLNEKKKNQVRVQGRKVQVFSSERTSVSRSLIEEMMILGGEVERILVLVFFFFLLFFPARLLLRLQLITKFRFHIACNIQQDP
jgi:hypothetical protein